MAAVAKWLTPFIITINLPQVKKIVQGQFGLFQSMYTPLLQEYEAKELLRFSSFNSHQANISQVCLHFQVLKLKHVGFCTYNWGGGCIPELILYLKTSGEFLVVSYKIVLSQISCLWQIYWQHYFFYRQMHIHTLQWSFLSPSRKPYTFKPLITRIVVCR